MKKPLLQPQAPLSFAGEARIERLASAVDQVRRGDRLSPRTLKLLRSGTPKMAQEVVEEAAELSIEAVRGQRRSLINESVDLIYNLTVLWSALGVSPEEVWAEMDRREAQFGMAEKLPKNPNEDP